MRGTLVSVQQDIHNIYCVLGRHESRLIASKTASNCASSPRPRQGSNRTHEIRVVQLPGLNRDRDMITALTLISGQAPVTVWQTETEIPDVDLIVIPGGFSYGDYLRCGAIAARMPVMQAIKAKAEQGVKVLACATASRS